MEKTVTTKRHTYLIAPIQIFSFSQIVLIEDEYPPCRNKEKPSHTANR
jgi:hypothetical protein